MRISVGIAHEIVDDDLSFLRSVVFEFRLDNARPHTAGKQWKLSVWFETVAFNPDLIPSDFHLFI